MGKHRSLSTTTLYRQYHPDRAFGFCAHAFRVQQPGPRISAVAVRASHQPRFGRGPADVSRPSARPNTSTSGEGTIEERVHDVFDAIASSPKFSGLHTMKFGFEGRMIRVNVWEARSAGTSVSAQPSPKDRIPTPASASAGNGLASLLLGTGSGNLIQAWKNVAAQSFYYAGYIQDDWRVTPRAHSESGSALRPGRSSAPSATTGSTTSIPMCASPLAQVVPGFADLPGGVIFVGVDGNSRQQ